MAQTGYTPISIYYSSTASNTPTAGNLVAGELAINTADGKLFYKDSAGVVQVIGTKGGVGSSTTTQVLYNSSGLVVGSANLTFNGTTLTTANDASISGLTVGKGGGAVSSNTMVGRSVGSANTTGSNNSVLGNFAFFTNTTGSFNTAIGDGSLLNNTTASNNTAVGYQAGYSNTTGTDNAFIGYQAGYSNTATSVVGVGSQALYSNTGDNNVGIGYRAGYSNTSGANNVAIGGAALRSNTTASNNTAVGYQAGYSNTTGGITAVGFLAGYNNTTAAGNTAIGNQAFVGGTGAYNTVVGASAAYNTTTATNTTAIGYSALNSLTTGTYNTVVGNASGSAITTGGKNSILGSYNGNQGGLDIRTASNYIVLSDGDGTLGYVYANGTSFFGTTPSSYSGNGAVTVVSDGTARPQIRTYDTYASAATNNAWSIYRNGSQVGSVTTTLSATAYNTSSDYRLKENIAPMTGALATVAQLKPVTYDWKVGGSSQGFIAHELAEVVPDCVTGEKDAVDAEGKPVYQGIDTSFLVATLTAAIQEQQAMIETLTTRLNALEGK